MSLCCSARAYADAALRECNDFLGDKSCRWVGINFEMQGVACSYEGSGHDLNDFRSKA
jgi:hypothetical protein